MFTSGENGIANEPMLLWPVWTTCETSMLWKSDELVHMLLSVKCCCFCRILYFWTSPSEEKEEEEERRRKEKYFGCLVTPWLSAFAVLCCATRRVVGHQNTQRWIVCCHKDTSLSRGPKSFWSPLAKLCTGPKFFMTLYAIFIVPAGHNGHRGWIINGNFKDHYENMYLNILLLIEVTTSLYYYLCSHSMQGTERKLQPPPWPHL